MNNPMFTSAVAKAHREDLLREAHRERQVTEALARDSGDAADRQRLLTRLVATAQPFLRVAGKAAPAEGH